MAEKYKTTYESELKKQNEGLQTRILAAVTGSGRDPEVEEFVKSVIAIAEKE